MKYQYNICHYNVNGIYFSHNLTELLELHMVLQCTVAAELDKLVNPLTTNCCRKCYNCQLEWLKIPQIYPKNFFITLQNFHHFYPM